MSATDNAQVAKVLITISDEQAETLEQGEAASAIDDPWRAYETLTEGIIVVEAFDLAGNGTGGK